MRGEVFSKNRALQYMGAESGTGEGSSHMLMMGTVVLFNSAKLLKMGVFVVFMHD